MSSACPMSTAIAIWALYPPVALIAHDRYSVRDSPHLLTKEFGKIAQTLGPEFIWGIVTQTFHTMDIHPPTSFCEIGL